MSISFYASQVFSAKLFQRRDYKGAFEIAATAAFSMVIRHVGHGLNIAQARAGWEEANRMIADPELRVAMFDELNIVLRHDYLPWDEVKAALEARSTDKHILIAGRNAMEELIEMADLATEKEQLKHPFRSGVKAQPGVEL